MWDHSRKCNIFISQRSDGQTNQNSNTINLSDLLVAMNLYIENILDCEYGNKDTCQSITMFTCLLDTVTCCDSCKGTSRTGMLNIFILVYSVLLNPVYKYYICHSQKVIFMWKRSYKYMYNKWYSCENGHIHTYIISDICLKMVIYIYIVCLHRV